MIFLNIDVDSEELSELRTTSHEEVEHTDEADPRSSCVTAHSFEVSLQENVKSVKIASTRFFSV